MDALIVDAKLRLHAVLSTARHVLSRLWRVD